MNDAFFQNFVSFGVAYTILFGIFSIVFSLLIWLIMRPVWCWYFKINQNINLLTEIRDTLLEIKRSGLSDSNSGNDSCFSDIETNSKMSSNSDFTPQMPVSKCHIDKPIHSSIKDKKWMPPKNKK